MSAARRWDDSIVHWMETVIRIIATAQASQRWSMRLGENMGRAERVDFIDTLRARFMFFPTVQRKSE